MARMFQSLNERFTRNMQPYPQYSGVAYGMTLLFYIGMAIGPAVVGPYMQSYQVSISTIAGLASYPSAESYNLIFLTAWSFR
jgi:hypothetical protein